MPYLRNITQAVSTLRYDILRRYGTDVKLPGGIVSKVSCLLMRHFHIRDDARWSANRPSPQPARSPCVCLPFFLRLYLSKTHHSFFYLIYHLLSSSSPAGLGSASRDVGIAEEDLLALKWITSMWENASTGQSTRSSRRSRVGESSLLTLPSHKYSPRTQQPNPLRCPTTTGSVPRINRTRTMGPSWKQMD